MAKKPAAVPAFKKGDMVVFNAYVEEVPEDEQVLVEGEQYLVASINEDNNAVVLELDNPDFNPKKKESADNTKTIQVDAFFDEVSLVPEDEQGDDQDEDEVQEAPPARTKGRTKAVVEEPAPAAKGKAKAAVKAPAKSAKASTKVAAKAKAPKIKDDEEKAESDALPELESEDEEIVELINAADDLVSLASELVESSAALDYKLGGVLYHTRLSKAYHEVKEGYADKGGWQLFIEEELPGLGYRKAMHLINIYYNFNLYNIDADKVAELGWTKCSKIAQVMTKDNAEELIELAGESSVADLSSTIQESYKDVSNAKGEVRKKVAFKFRLFEDQAVGVSSVFANVQSAMGFKDPSDAFEHIVMEWAAEHDIEVEVPKAKAKASAKAKATETKGTPAKAAAGKARARV